MQHTNTHQPEKVTHVVRIAIVSCWQRLHVSRGYSRSCAATNKLTSIPSDVSLHRYWDGTASLSGIGDRTREVKGCKTLGTLARLRRPRKAFTVNESPMSPTTTVRGEFAPVNLLKPTPLPPHLSQTGPP